MPSKSNFQIFLQSASAETSELSSADGDEKICRATLAVTKHFTRPAEAMTQSLSRRGVFENMNNSDGCFVCVAAAAVSTWELARRTLMGSEPQGGFRREGAEERGEP